MPFNDVSALAGDTSFEQIEISGGTLSSGTVSLNSIGSITTNLSYVFLNGFTVASGATVAVGPNVPVSVAGGETLSDAGTLSLAAGDSFTLDDPCCYTPAQISVSGSLIASDTTFSGDTRTNFTITSTGSLSGGANIFNVPLIVPYTLVPALSSNTSSNRSRSVTALCRVVRSHSTRSAAPRRT